MRPLPTLNGRVPVIVPQASAKPRSIELAYARTHAGELAATYPIGANGTAAHFMPTDMPAFCARDGVIRYANQIGHGYAMVIDHLDGWSTYYSNLDEMFASPTDKHRVDREARVKAGDILGYIGSIQPGSFKCLHFELWERDHADQFIDVDPRPFLARWSALPWTDARLTPAQPAIAEKAA